MTDSSELLKQRTLLYESYLSQMVQYQDFEPEPDCYIVFTEKPDGRFLQFAFREGFFYVELLKNTLSPAEAERLIAERPGFYFSRDRRLPDVSEEDWQKLVEAWDPVQKVYPCNEADSAAEDMAYILHTLWHFPLNRQFYYTAGRFSGGEKRVWEGAGIVTPDRSGKGELGNGAVK